MKTIVLLATLFASAAAQWAGKGPGAAASPPPPTSSPPPSPSPLGDDCVCDETCIGMPSWASDGYCDDGGEGAEYSSCSAGTDCADCGARCGDEIPSPSPDPEPSPPPPPPSPPSPPTPP